MRRLFYGIIILFLTLPLSANWWEELSEDNSEKEKKKIEKKLDKTVSRKEKRKSNNPEDLKFAVSLLEARLVSKKGEVELSWMDIDDPTATYRIYRAQNVIDNDEKLAEARYLGSVGSGIQKYKDTLTESGSYYYAIITQIDDEEKRVFMFEQSYTVQPVYYEIADMHIYVKDLKAVYNRFLKTVFLRWTRPDTSKPYEMMIYRGTEPINAVEKITSSELLTIVSPPEKRYTDNQLTKNGTFYYSVVVKLKSSEEPEKYFKVNENYTTNGITIANQGEKVVFKDLPTETGKSKTTGPTGKTAKKPNIDTLINEALQNNHLPEKSPETTQKEVFFTKDFETYFDEDEKYIRLVWRVDDNIESPFYINIYKKTNAITDINEFKNNRFLIENLKRRSVEKGERFEYRDFDIKGGQNYYYAVLIDNGKDFAKQKLKLLDNYIKYPIRVPAHINTENEKKSKLENEKNSSEKIWAPPGESDPVNKKIKQDIKTLAENYFRKKHYVYTASRLKEMLKNENIDEENKKRIHLFLGRSYLGLSQYDNALKEFYKLKELDHNAGTFWINKTVNHY